eukprot:366488-Chlamydomonas_euryale.AAC.12
MADICGSGYARTVQYGTVRVQNVSGYGLGRPFCMLTTKLSRLVACPTEEWSRAHLLPMSLSSVQPALAVASVLVLKTNALPAIQKFLSLPGSSEG